MPQNPFPLLIPLTLLTLLSILPPTICSQPKLEPFLQQQNISPEQDAQIQRLSNFFIELITQYDQTGNGLIKKSVYPFFLRDVFLKGSFGTQDADYQHGELLLQATTEFTATKDEKIDTVSVQEFYDDIIAKFTLFLMENQKYKVVLDTLFEDLQSNTQKNTNTKPAPEQIQL